MYRAKRPGAAASLSPGRPVRVVHVGHDQPQPAGPLAQRERELPDVRLSLLPREPADDVGDRPLRRKREGTKDERTARALVVSLDRGASPDRRAAVGQHEPVFVEEPGECGPVSSPPPRLVVGQHASQLRRQLHARFLRGGRLLARRQSRDPEHRGDGGDSFVHFAPSGRSLAPTHRVSQRMYFQFRGLPAAIHSTAVSIRFLRVSPVLASVIHSTYSLLWLGLKPSNVARAFAFFFKVAARSGGVAGAFFGRGCLRGAFSPISFNRAASRTWPTSTLSLGRSESNVIRPNWPMASGFSGTINLPFQNPKAQWLLKAAIPQSIPSYMKCGELHFIVSSTCGHPLCTISRRCRRIGFANSADLAV